MADNENHHGYAWSDGTVHDVPESAKAIEHALTPREKQNLRDIEDNKTRHVTRETYDRAYAQWVKDYAEWRKRMDAWEAKYGSKV